MRDTLRLGRLGGVPVGLNWSLAVVAALLAFVLAQNRLPFDAPGYPSTAYAVAGVLTAIGLLVTVLAHELGHAVVARRFRMRVDGITLSWIGGITRIEGDSAGPGVEAAIAGVGPLVSLATGGLLWALRYGCDQAGVGRLAVAALGWLAVINVVLAVFNLLPASPLDGGRILHAAAWRITGDRWRAGRVASMAGIGFGSLVIALGAYQAATGTGTGGAFDAFITGLLGWWLIAAARGEGQVATLHRVLDGCRCSDIMRPVRSGPGWMTTDHFLAAHDHGPITPVWLLESWEDTGYTGVVSTEALRAVPPHLRPTLRAVDVAVPVSEAAGAHPDDAVLATLAASSGARVVLVVDGGHTVGAIVPADVDAMLHSGQRLTQGSATPSGAGAG